MISADQIERLLAEYERIAALQRDLVAEIGRAFAAIQRQVGDEVWASPLDRPQFLNVEETARALGFKPGRAGCSRVYRMISAGQLRAVRLGRALRVPVAEIQRLAQAPSS